MIAKSEKKAVLIIGIIFLVLIIIKISLAVNINIAKKQSENYIAKNNILFENYYTKELWPIIEKINEKYFLGKDKPKLERNEVVMLKKTYYNKLEIASYLSRHYSYVPEEGVIIDRNSLSLLFHNPYEAAFYESAMRYYNQEDVNEKVILHDFEATEVSPKEAYLNCYNDLKKLNEYILKKLN